MEKICKNCKYRSGVTCVSEKFKFGYNKEIDQNSDEILIENDEGWGCVIGEKFGCKHFENKLLK